MLVAYPYRPNFSRLTSTTSSRSKHNLAKRIFSNHQTNQNQEPTGPGVCVYQLCVIVYVNYLTQRLLTTNSRLDRVCRRSSELAFQPTSPVQRLYVTVTPSSLWFGSCYNATTRCEINDHFKNCPKLFEDKIPQWTTKNVTKKCSVAN